MRPSLAAALLLALIATAAPAEETPRAITVTGSAQVDGTPDLATISAGVQTQAANAAQALSDNATAMTEVFSVLEAAGIDKADIQTNQLSLDPIWEQPTEAKPNPTEVTGYQANNAVTIRVHDIGALGGVIDALGGAGANRIFGITFEIENPRPLLDTARKNAVIDARAKAELMAEAAGVTLGPVLSIHESPNMGAPGPLRAKMDMAPATPVASGTVSLGVEVELVYQIN